MPAAAVYVVAAVAGVAAALAFKEFVYDPHLAPKVDRFFEDLAHSRREAAARRRARSRGIAAVPVALPESDSEYGAPQGRRRRPARHEVDELVEQEMQVWRDGDQSGMRRRTGFLDEASRTTSRTATPPPAGPVGYDASPLPAAAAALIAAASGPMSPSARTSESATPHQVRSPGVMSPRSAAVLSPRSDHSSTLFSVSSRSSTPDLLSPQPQAAQPLPPPPAYAPSPPAAARSPPARVLSPFSDIEMPTSPFADVHSPRAGSPFSDFMAVAREPAALSAPPLAAAASMGTVRAPSPRASPRAGSDAELLSDAHTTDDEMFSLATESELGDADRDLDLLSDIGSVHGSDLSGWESVSGRQR